MPFHRNAVTIAAAVFPLVVLCPTYGSSQKEADYPKSVAVQRAAPIEQFKTKRPDVITKVQGFALPVRLPVPPFVHVYSAECELSDGAYICDIRAHVDTEDVDRCIAYYDGVFWDHEWARYHAGPPEHSVHAPTRFAEHPETGEAKYGYYNFSPGKDATPAVTLMVNRLPSTPPGGVQQLRIVIIWPVKAK